MARILVVYDSRTGNTEKMALAIAEGVRRVKDVEVILKKVSQTGLQDLCHAEGIMIGSPAYYGQMSGKLKTMFDESVKIHGKLDGKVGAAFTSSGGTATGAETTSLSIVETMLVHGMIVQGRYDDKHYGAAAVGSPTGKEIERALICKGLGFSRACALRRGGPGAI